MSKGKKLPRKKKKQIQKQAQKIQAQKQGLQSYYDAPKPTAVEAQKIIKNKNRADQQRSRIKSYREYAISKGVPPELITNAKISSKEKTEQLINDYNASLKQAQKTNIQLDRFEKKIQHLINNGLSYEEARKIVGSPSRQISYKKLYEYSDNIVIECKSYLYVGFADTSGQGFYMERLDVESSLQSISDRLKEAHENIDDSGSNFHGVFVIDFGSNEAMETKAYAYYSRSVEYAMKHAKFDGKQYQKICVSNKWSKKDFLNLVNSCLQQMSNADAVDFFGIFKDYCTANNLPFLDEIN